MGLDVYKMMVVEESEHFLNLFEDEENKSMKALFNHFKNYVKDVFVEVYGWERHSQAWGCATKIGSGCPLPWIETVL